MNLAHKIGALFYIFWGMIHILGGSAIMLQDKASAQLAMQGTARPIEEFEHISNATLNGILSYHGFNIVWFGIFVIVVAIAFNWKNKIIGYWLNLTVISAIEIGLIVFMLIPENMLISDGSIGIVLFLLALTFTTIGLRHNKHIINS